MMTMTMTTVEVLNEYPSSDLEIRKSMESLEKVMESQKLLFHRQIDQLRTIVNTQCKLTGVNPLSQEMAAGALSIKIGKRPRDMLNPKAVKYMQSVFSVKDAVSKKESREISALFGLTVTQVREYFANQRSRVRKMVRLSRDKAIRANIDKEFQDNMSTSDPMQPIDPVPLSTIAPSSAEEAPSCSNQDEVLPGLGESEKQFVENIFSSMCKEEAFSGQMKLMEWILQIQNPSVLCWFLTKGGVMIIATWLSQAASDEQTTVLSVALKVLCHLPLHKSLPAHMSVILQAVNKLRFYRISDISNRARVLLSKWSKLFSKSQASKKLNGIKSGGVQEMDLSQRIGELIGDASWKTSVDNPDSALISSNADIFDTRKMETPQAVKLLTAPDDSNKKFILGTSSIYKERRKVLLVEQPGQKTAVKSQQVKAAGANQARPVTADEIQKAKLRAQLMQSSRTKSEGPRTSSLLTNDFLSASEAYLRPKLEAQKKARVFPPKNSKPVDSPSDQKPMVLPPEISKLVDSPSDQKPMVLPPEISKLVDSPSDQKPMVLLPGVGKLVDSPSDQKPMVLPPEISKLIDSLSEQKPTLDLKESLLDKCRRVQIPWRAPPEVQLDAAWGVGTGGISKEIEAQKNRMRREKETNYLTLREVPPNPKDPWDVEMDFDDSLTPEIPIDQLPDADADTDMTEPPLEGPSGSEAAMPEPDLELLAVLLKNPELVFALTKGQEIGLSSEDTVKLLDMLKANNGGESVLNGMGPTKMVEVSSLPSPTPHRNNVEVEVSLPSPTPPCRFEVSLPSPTPSINPGPSGWATQGATKNPFSRQTRMTSFSGDVFSADRLQNNCTLQSQSTSLPTNPQFSHHPPSRVSSYVPETARTTFFATQNPAPINHLAVNSSYSHSTVPQPHLNSRVPNLFSSRVDQNGYDPFVGGQGSESSRGRDNFYQGGQSGFESWGPGNHRNGPQGWGQQDQRGRGYGHGPPDNRHSRGQQNWHGNRRWNEGDRRR